MKRNFRQNVKIEQITAEKELFRRNERYLNTPEIKEELTKLRGSINELGIATPLKIQETAKNQYRLLSGFMRFTAAKLEKLPAVPAFIYPPELSEAEALLIVLADDFAIIEHSPIDLSKRLKRLNELGIKQKQIAVTVAKSPAWVSQSMKIAELPETTQDLAEEADLSRSQVLEVSKVPEEEQPAIIEEIEGKSTRETSEIVTDKLEEDKAKERKEAKIKAIKQENEKIKGHIKNLKSDLKGLEKNAKDAQKVKVEIDRLEGELKEFPFEESEAQETLILSDTIAEHYTELNKKKLELEELETEIEGLEEYTAGDIRELKKTWDNTEKEFEKTTQKLSELREKVTALVKQKDNLDKQGKEDKKRYINVKDSIDKLGQLKAKHGTFENTIDHTKSEIEKETKNLKKLSEKLPKEQRADLQQRSSDKIQLAELKSKFSSLNGSQSKRGEKETELERLKTQLNNKLTELDKVARSDTVEIEETA